MCPEYCGSTSSKSVLLGTFRNIAAADKWNEVISINVGGVQKHAVSRLPAFNELGEL